MLPFRVFCPPPLVARAFLCPPTRSIFVSWGAGRMLWPATSCSERWALYRTLFPGTFRPTTQWGCKTRADITTLRCNFLRDLYDWAAFDILIPTLLRGGGGHRLAGNRRRCSLEFEKSPLLFRFVLSLPRDSRVHLLGVWSSA